MVRTGVQLYTLREMDATVPEMLAAVGRAGFDGVEFAYRVLDADIGACADAMAEHDLDAAGAHVGLEAVEGGVTHADAYHELGVERLVVAGIEESHFDSEVAVAEAATRLDAAAETAADAGFELGYHNHDHEFQELGGRSAYEALVEETERVTFELDIGWAHHGGSDPAVLLERYGERIPSIHVTDVTAEGAHTDLGAGDVDLRSALSAAETVGTEWFVYEHDDPEDELDTLAHAAHVLSDLL